MLKFYGSMMIGDASHEIWVGLYGTWKGLESPDVDEREKGTFLPHMPLEI